MRPLFASSRAKAIRAGTGIDPSKVKIEIEAPPDLPPLDFGQPPAKQ
jgi:hypothetical protein